MVPGVRLNARVVGTLWDERRCEVRLVYEFESEVIGEKPMPVRQTKILEA